MPTRNDTTLFWADPMSPMSSTGTPGHAWSSTTSPWRTTTTARVSRPPRKSIRERRSELLTDHAPTERRQAVGDVGVAPLDHLPRLDHRRALGRQPGDDQSDTGAQIVGG